MRRAAAGAQRRRSGEVLPRPERTKGAGGDRSHGTRTLVRGVTDGVEVRAMGRRPGADSGQTSAEAQERPRGRATPAQATGGRSLSPGVGTECRESGCAPTALAPASAVADAHTGHESVAGHRPERRGAAQEGVVEPAGAGAIRDANASSLGYTTPERSVRLARPPQPEDRGVKRGDRARSRATAGSETADDPPGCRAPHRPGLCLDHWVSGAASRSAAIWGWLPARTPVPIASGWDISASKGTLCYVSCWWRPRRPSSASTPSGDVTSCTWRCVGTARSPRWRWHASWPSASIGCGARDGITSRWHSLVRTWESP